MFHPEALRQLAQAQGAWNEEVLGPALERSPERQEAFHCSAGPVQRLYTPSDIAELDYLRDLGFPGAYPFTRGTQPTMYRTRFWTMRQYAGFGAPEETNQRFRFLLEEGQTGLSIAFDLPTQLGYDSDDPRAEGEVGRVGVAVDSLRDMELMFEGIPLNRVSTSMTINAPAPVLLAMYLAVAQKQGVPFSALNGTVQNDVLKEYVARGTHIFPPQPSLRLAADLIVYCARQVPRWNPISISGYHIRDCGATAVQEIAFTLANALAYLAAVQERGLEVDAFAPRISWIFNTHNHFFEEVAKFRALRRLWARLMRERCGAQDPRSWMLRTHTQTGGSTLTAQQPEVNIVRATLQALAAVLGGVQSLALSCYDEALAIPTEEAQRLALRTQQVIAQESGVADTVDPLAGSYYVEALTNALEAAAQEYLRKIEAMGGALAAIEGGYMQREIQEAAYQYQREIEAGQRIIVGINRYQVPERRRIATFRPDPQVVQRQVQRLQELRHQRHGRRVQKALVQLRKAAEGQESLMPPILEAVRTYATLGEICGILRQVFGEYTPPVVF